MISPLYLRATKHMFCLCSQNLRGLRMLIIHLGTKFRPITIVNTKLTLIGQRFIRYRSLDFFLSININGNQQISSYLEYPKWKFNQSQINKNSKQIFYQTRWLLQALIVLNWSNTLTIHIFGKTKMIFRSALTFIIQILYRFMSKTNMRVNTLHFRS